MSRTLPRSDLSHNREPGVPHAVYGGYQLIYDLGLDTLHQHERIWAGYGSSNPGFEDAVV